MSEALDTSLRLFREIRSSLLEATLSPDLRTALIAHIEESVHRSRALTYRDMFKIAGEDRSQVQAGSLEATAETLRILAEARENKDEPELPRKWLSSAWAALTYEGGQSPACAKLLSRETSQAWEQAETAQSEAEGPVEALETKALECLLALLCQDLRVAHSSARSLLERVTSVEEEVVQSFVEGDYTRADLEHFAGQTLLLRGIAAVSARLLMLDEQSEIPYSTYFDDAANIYRHLGSSVHWLLSRLLGTAMAEVAKASTVGNLRDLFEDGREMEYLHSLLSTDRKIFQLWPSQLEAVRQGVFDAGLARAAVSMPTSAGKTLIAEGLIARELLRDPVARCAYLAPTRALVSEVERKLERSLRPLGIGVGQISAASELSPIETEIALENRLLCLTPEKLDVFLRLEHEILDSVRLIIVDEGQLLEEEERGQLLELAIVKLQLRFPATRIVFLSAVIPNPDKPEPRRSRLCCRIR